MNLPHLRTVAITTLTTALMTAVNVPVASSAREEIARTVEDVPALTRQSLRPAPGFEKFASFPGDRSFHSDIAFYETVLSYGPVNDPRPIFLLANAYIVTNQQPFGIAFLEKQLAAYSAEMAPETQAVYLSALAMLRATHAGEISFLSRIVWVWDTFEVLEEAQQLTGNQHPLVHWASGIIYAQVPGIFGKRDEARAHLEWLVARPELEPTPGFYREAYRHLANLHEIDGNHELAKEYMAKSGYGSEPPETLYMGWFATDAESGLRFAPNPSLAEIIPNRVFAVRGFGFSELHFVVSKDGKELISIDAGTQPGSYEQGLEFLREHRPDLPPLTNVFITHAHWDHIGGHTYLRSLDDKITFFGRENYAGTVARADRNHVYDGFRSESFQSDWITSYRPDIAVSELTTVTIGETQIDLVPAIGGETEDALLIFLPDLDVAFAGDAFMPFYGEPWVEEGFIEEAQDTLDAIIEREPEFILHGHYGLTEIYGTLSQLQSYRTAYSWLIDVAVGLLENGYSAEDIRRLNLIPPGLEKRPEGYFGYVAARDHVIARISDKMTGIWRENRDGDDPLGLDTLTLIEYGRMLDLYLDLSEGEIEDGIERMIAGGDNELALKMASAAHRRFPENEDILALRTEAADRLRSATQYFDPFRFTTYTEISGRSHPSMMVPEAE